jgi:sugar lactone lactonase YvrE
VTDSLQATIFRYMPGGGAPEIWFQSAQFESGGFLPAGANGIRLDPAREHLYVVGSTSAADPDRGTIYRLPLQEGNEKTDLEIVHEYTEGEGPDQFAFGKAGDIYVLLALSNQISVLAPDGTEIVRVQSAPDDNPPSTTRRRLHSIAEPSHC